MITIMLIMIVSFYGYRIDMKNAYNWKQNKVKTSVFFQKKIWRRKRRKKSSSIIIKQKKNITFISNWTQIKSNQIKSKRNETKGKTSQCWILIFFIRFSQIKRQLPKSNYHHSFPIELIFCCCFYRILYEYFLDLRIFEPFYNPKENY